MFRNRRTGQKPGDDLIANFRQAFPRLSPNLPTTASSTAAPNSRSMSLGDVHSETAVNYAHVRQNLDHDQDAFSRDMDQTPKGNPESWRLTPSLLDPNSYAFTSFANQPPGYYTPTSGGTNTFYHNQAGVLHTPTIGLGAMTPSSLPTPEPGLPVAAASLEPHGFPPGPLQTHHFTHFDTFAPQGSFAPSHFQNQPISYDSMDASGDASPMNDGSAMDHDLPDRPTAVALPLSSDTSVPAPSSDVPSHQDPFRFHVTLNAPTAMIKRADEIPVTYLNKGQAYTISIIDTAPPSAYPGPVTYRTFVRVSFEDEQQRQRPGACWQLWKEGRGTNEAHQRGGKLQAVECVDPNFTGDSETTRLPKIDLESASFDGFSVNWTPAADSPRECAVAVRFNFLSTDFSHSKGVKGIPVRLCAKTEIVPASANAVPSPSATELCYCKVKLFRDHGAERKLSNDVAHVKKTIEKLQQQIAQAETGVRDFSSKKRKSPTSIGKTTAAPTKPGKAVKHKRTWSISSNDSGGVRSPAEDDLHQKLATMQDMFSSTRPSSLLYLRGVEQDDPDLHPVRLTGEPLDLVKSEYTNEMWSRRSSAATGSKGDPSSLVSPESNSSGNVPQAQPRPPHLLDGEWNQPPSMLQADLRANPQHLASPPDQTVRVPKMAVDTRGHLADYIDAVGVDRSYQPPAVDPASKPVACFYVLPRLAGRQPADQCYRAVYLMQRNVREFVRSIANKLDMPASLIQRALYVNPKGLNILLDDDVVRQLPEGQDMILEVAELNDYNAITAVKRDGDFPAATDTHIDDGNSGNEPRPTVGYELKLLF